MIRKTLLMILTFAVLMGVFVVYREVFSVAPGPRGNAAKPLGNMPVLPDDTSQAASQPTTSPFAGGREIGTGVELDYTNYNDRTRQMSWAFHASRYDRESDGSLTLQKPSIQFFQTKSRVYLLGDRGRVYYEQVKGKVKPNSGHFEGNVLILIDRNPEGTYATIDQRPEDVIRIKMSDVDFDNSQLKISTPGRIDLQSHQMDVLGDGLTMRLEQAPSELRSLRIEHGISMTVKRQMEGFAQMMPTATSGPTTAAVPMELTPLLAESQLPAQPPAVEDPDLAAIDNILRNGPDLAALASSPIRTPTSKPASKPAKPGKSDKGQDYGPKKNVFYAEFEDPASAMIVDSPGGKLQNVQRLAMIFNWDSGDKKQMETTTKPGHTKGSTTMPTSAKAPKEAPLAEKPTVIRWSGPLTLLPLEYSASSNKHDYKIYARGDKMEMVTEQKADTDRQSPVATSQGTTNDRQVAGAEKDKESRVTTAHLRELYYYSIVPAGKVDPVERGRLIGTDTQKVRLEMPGGGLLESPVVKVLKLDKVTMRVDLIGNNLTEVPAKAAMAMTGAKDRKAATQPEAGATSKPAGPSVITSDTWTLAYMGQRRDEKGKQQWFIRQAQCMGKTTVTRPITNETVACEKRTYIEMNPQENWQQLRMLRGQGNLHAQFMMDKNHWDIKSEDAEVHFSPVTQEDGSRAAQPMSMKANKVAAITIQQPKDDKTGKTPEPIVLTAADHAEGDMVESRYELYGTATQPATASQVDKGTTVAGNKWEGLNGVQGPHIILTEKDKQQFVQVVGGGRLNMMSDRGPNNEVLEIPLPVLVTWTGMMNFSGAKNQAEFRGDVKMDRAHLDQISGQWMDVYFARAATSQPATEPSVATASPAPGASRKAAAAARGKSRSMVPKMMDFKSLQGLRVSSVTVKDDVEVLSRHVDVDGHMTYRMRLTCNDLNYEAIKKLMTVTGAGTMLAEDYNKPKAPAATAPKDEDSPLAGKRMILSPSRSAFAWSNLMQLSQAADKSSTVQLDGDVLMVHHSGDQLDIPEQDKRDLNVPDWGKLPAGRHSVLACKNMLVEFGKPEKPAAASKPAAAEKTRTTSRPADETAQMGMEVGRLQGFKAVGDVSLTEGEYKLVGQRLIFDGKDDQDLVTVYGYMEGERKMLAQLTQTDPVKGPRTQEGEVIKWNVKTDSFSIQGGRITGGK